MTSSNGGSAGSHFRGRYSQANQQPAHCSPSPVASVTPVPSSAPLEPLTDPAAPHVAASSAVSGQQGLRSSQLLTPPLIGSGLLGIVLVLTLAKSPRSSTTSPQETNAISLNWQASCGSPSVSGASWWPVLGPDQAVNDVRSRYCGDAYITAAGATQVASFSTIEEATAFAERLSRATGYGFRVGERRSP